MQGPFLQIGFAALILYHHDVELLFDIMCVSSLLGRAFTEIGLIHS